MPDALAHIDLDTTPDADYTWTSPCGDYSVAAWLEASPEGVSLTLQTDTCGRGRTVMTQPMPPECAFALGRMIFGAATDATLQASPIHDEPEVAS